MPPEKFTEAQKREIRRKRLEGEYVDNLAEEYGACTTTIWKVTKDLGLKRRGNFGIRGKTMEILQKVMRDGYYFNEHTCKQRMHTLMRLFPIRRVAWRQRTIYFMEGQGKTAMSQLIKKYHKKIFSHREVMELGRMFGIGKGNKREIASMLKRSDEK